MCLWASADEGGDVHALVGHLGLTPVVPPESNRKKPWRCNKKMGKRRPEIERYPGGLKDFDTSFDVINISYSMNGRVSMRYRPEIDGLRALAVAAVVIGHAQPKLLSGGYVGVDVFFVISGFLITGIIAKDMSTGRFSLIDFYERRCRRIMPPLLTVIAVTAIFSWFILLPRDLNKFGKSMIATATFWGNILFWLEAGYFEASALTKPLLHTWSLAIEEQYYLFFPIFLWLLLKKGKKFILLKLTCGLFVFFLISAFVVSGDPTTGFYWLHSRVWEFLLGSIAFFLPRNFSLNRTIANILAIVAIGLLARSMIFYHQFTMFPGVHALAPCLGAFLLIVVHNQGPNHTIIGRFLCIWPMRRLGLISYSLYLWHWPLLVLPIYYKNAPLTYAESIIAIIGAIILSLLTWHLVEQPIRKKTFLITRRSLFIWCGVGIMSIATCGTFLLFYDKTAHLSPKEAVFMNAFDDYYQVSKKIPVLYTTSLKGIQYKVKGWQIRPQSNIEPSFVVLGDSHANMWRAALESMAEKYGVNGLIIDPQGCRMILPDNDQTEWNCGDYNQAIREMCREKGIKTVLLAIRYVVYEYLDELYVDYVPKPDLSKKNNEDRNEDRRAHLGNLVKTAAKAWNNQGAEVWIMENAPDYNAEIVVNMTRAAMAGRPIKAEGYDVSICWNRQAPMKMVINEAIGPQVHWLETVKYICPDGWCLPGDENGPFYADKNHLTNYGALYFQEALAPMFESLPKIGSSIGFSPMARHRR